MKSDVDTVSRRVASNRVCDVFIRVSCVLSSEPGYHLVRLWKTRIRPTALILCDGLRLLMTVGDSKEALMRMVMERQLLDGELVSK